MNDHLRITGEIIGLVSAALGLLSLVIPQWRDRVFSRIQKILGAWNKWVHKDMHNRQLRILDLLEKGAPRWNESAVLGRENAEAIAELKRIVTNGLSHSVLRLVARDRSDFESKLTPAFVCDEDAKNHLVSQGYRHLIGVDKEFLTGNGWENVVYGPLKDQYLHTFQRCVATQEDFTATVDFQHPLTGEHKGRWRIHAPCEVIGPHLMFSGQPVLAEDETAAEIVRENSWPIAIATNLLREGPHS